MMRRKRPRILGSLRNPVPPKDLSLPSDQPKNIHFFPPQTPMPQPTFRTNPLFVFYPTSFPALRNTSYFPTLMIAMPSSSCVNKLSSKHPSYFQTPSFLSTLMSTSSPRALLDSCLVPLSHLETSYFQPEEVPGNLQPGTETGNHEVEDAQSLDDLDAFTQETLAK
ncbi:RIKEN cDNA 1700129C05, isoform CRA_b [Mus musculus]|nr:RIKEN cDNA 1700129C05, isoform CRA_b [Mus musculus]